MTQAFVLPQVGDLLAEKYRVLRVVADGGMGVVFEAHHELLGKNVALKFPLPELAHVPNIAERFLAEARLCARIENQHVVRVLDVSKLGGLPYIVMELVTGVSLASEMGQPWPPAKAAAYAAQVLEGLEAVHALGIVHRDVKPENVLVVRTSRGPILKLIDFGIAKDSIAQEATGRLTRAGAMLGTPAYMAPEQIRDPIHASSAVDLYSTGILLFEMLAGTSPFSGTTVDELTEQALSGHLRPLLGLVPGTPPGLVDVVSRATALRAADRFASASDFKRALWPFAEGWAPSASALRTELAEPSALRTELAERPALRTELAEPPVARGVPVPPAPIAPSAREANHVRVLASAALGVILLFALVGIALAVHRRQSADSSPPPPLASEAPETLIAPLDTESPDPSGGAGNGASVLKHTETRAAAPPKEPSAETLSVVQADARRLHACNTDAKASEVLVELHIADDGTVRSANAVSSSASAPVTACVLAECRALQFPPHAGPDQVSRVPIQLPAASPEQPPEQPPQTTPREHPRWPDLLPGRTRRRRPVE